MSSKTWTIKALLQVTSNYLTEKKIESPRLCAEILLAHMLQTTRVELYLHFEKICAKLSRRSTLRAGKITKAGVYP